MSILNKQFFLNLTSFTIYLYPLSLIFSPFLSNSLVFFIGLYGLFNIKNFQFESLIKNKFIICFLIFWIIITIRSFFTDYVLFSLKSSLLFVKYLLFIIGVIYVINKKIDFLNKFIKFFLIVYLVVIFDALIQFFVGVNLLGYDEVHCKSIKSLVFFFIKLKATSTSSSLAVPVLRINGISHLEYFSRSS